MDKEALITDWQFALDSGEFAGSMTRAMRYVAAINIGCSRREFVDTLATLGLNKHTLTQQFAQSRKFDVAYCGITVDAEGRGTGFYRP